MWPSIVTHVTWEVIWGGFNYTTRNYMGFYRPISVYIPHVNFTMYSRLDIKLFCPEQRGWNNENSDLIFDVEYIHFCQLLRYKDRKF